MIIGLFWMIVANAASFLGAYGLLRLLQTPSASLNLVIFLLLRMALISLAILFTGLAGVMTPWGLGIPAGVALVFLMAGGLYPRRWPSRMPPIGRGWIFLTGLVALRLLLQVWFFAPYVGDALSYHLPKVAEWTRSGAITSVVGSDWRSWFPAGFELIEIWWVVFLHHDVLIEMAGVEFLILSFASVYALSRTLGLEGRAAWLSALLYVLGPGIQLQSTSCLNDGPTAALILATAALLTARASPGLILLAAGAGIGIKAIYGYALPGLLLLRYLFREAPQVTPPPRWLTISLSSAGIILGSVWHIRNTILYGNPIYPIELRRDYLERDYPLQMRPRPSSLRKNIAILVDNRIYDPLAVGPELSEIAGWGAGLLCLGLPGLVLGLRESTLLRRLAVGMSTSMILILTMVQTDPWYLRFVLFFPSLLAISAVYLLERSAGLRPIFILSIIIQFLGGIVPINLPVGGVGSFARQGWQERRLLLDHLDRLGGEPVLCIEGLHPLYLLYGPGFRRSIHYARPRTPKELKDLMQKLGIRLLMSRQATLTDSLVREGWLLPLIGPFFQKR